MAGATLGIQVKYNDREIRQALNHLARAGADLRYHATRDSLEFGTDRKYGATHQLGDQERGIPARPFLGIDDQDRDEILAILRRHLEEALSG